MLNSLEVEGSIKTFNELGFKGWPLGLNFFDYQPLPDPGPVAETYEEMMTEKVPPEKIWPHVFVGMDSRESSPKLLEAVIKGL